MPRSRSMISGAGGPAGAAPGFASPPAVVSATGTPRSVRDVDQPIAARAHVALEQIAEYGRGRARRALADALAVPLHDRRDLDRAADQQHLARRARLGDR